MVCVEVKGREKGFDIFLEQKEFGRAMEGEADEFGSGREQCHKATIGMLF